MEGKSVIKILSMLLVGLLASAGVALADGEWTTSGNNIYNTNTGNIGIGTASPTKKLSVAGQIQAAGSSDYNRIEVIGTAADYNNNGFRLSDNYHHFNMAIDSSGNYLLNEYTGSTWLNRFTIKNGGNIGIGTITPAANLEIMANAESNEQLLFLKNFEGTRYYLGVSNVANYQRFFIGGNGGNALVIDAASNIGIGTNYPQSILSVNGTITTKKIKVTETGWSDFVFDAGYKLPTLAAVESHIKQYKHLPGIPSAREIKQKGLDVSDVLAKQMQKIEELTLYMIEMQKENQDLKKRINALEKQVTQN